MTGVLVGRGKFGHRNTQREKDHAKVEAETGVMVPQAKNTWGRQKLEGARKVPWEGAGPAHALGGGI